MSDDNCSCSPRYRPDCAYMKGGYCVDPALAPQPALERPDFLVEFKKSVASVNLLNGPRPGRKSKDWLDGQDRGLRQGLHIAETIVAELLASTPKSPALDRATSDLTKLAAECHRAKWQFDFNDEKRLSLGMARDMVKRAFGELHRIGDLTLKLRERVALGAGND